MNVMASAPAKLVLLGEYAVLEGATALVAAVDRRVEVEIEQSERAEWRFVSDLGGGREADVHWSADGWKAAVTIDDDSWLRLPVQVSAAVLDAAGVKPEHLPACDVHMRSADLYRNGGGTKLGLGSSAAVVVALAAALRHGLRVWRLDPTAPDRLTAYREDLALHHEVQDGRGSGIDVAASFHGGLRTYERQDGANTEIRLPDGVALSVVWTGQPASTPAFLELVEATRTSRPGKYAARIEALASAAAHGIDACRRNDAAAFLEAVQASHVAMDALGTLCGLPIVSADHAKIAAVASAEGLAYKPSGAGGGDVGLLFGPSDAALGKTGRLVEQAGYGLLDLAIDPEGVTVRRHERQTG